MARKIDEKNYLIEGWEFDNLETLIWSCSRPATPFTDRSYEDYCRRKQRIEELKKVILARPVRQQIVVGDVWEPGKERVWRWEMKAPVYTDLNLSWRYMLWRAIHCSYCKAFAHRHFKRYWNGSPSHGLDEFESLCPKCTIIDYKAQCEDQG